MINSTTDAWKTDLNLLIDNAILPQKEVSKQAGKINLTAGEFTSREERGGGGGYSSKFWIGVYCEGSGTLTLFKDYEVKTDTLFKAQTRKLTPYSEKKKNY